MLLILVAIIAGVALFGRGAIQRLIIAIGLIVLALYVLGTIISAVGG